MDHRPLWFGGEMELALCVLIFNLLNVFFLNKMNNKNPVPINQDQMPSLAILERLLLSSFWGRVDPSLPFQLLEAERHDTA